MSVPPGSDNLLREVRAGFIAQGVTLSAWCSANRVTRSYAHHVLRGHTNGPNALALRARLVGAATAMAA